MDQQPGSSQRFIDQEEPETTGDLVDTTAVTGRFDLTDAQWAVVEYGSWSAVHALFRRWQRADNRRQHRGHRCQHHALSSGATLRRRCAAL
jgi:hypothetical protein